jgi:YedE family putative selenium metabolism protein
MNISKEKKSLIIAGSLTGIISVVLVLLGNPTNMGFCIACFYRDIAGALSLHNAAVVQYIRPEIIGLLLGSMLISIMKKEFKPRGGSSPVFRFVISFFVMIGALVFLGCPFRMVLRLAGGDLNALVALFGFIAGIIAGSILLNKGFTLGRSYKQTSVEGGAIGGIFFAMLLVLLFIPSLLKFSTSGPGSLHAPIILSLLGGLLVGALAQRNRFCMAGGIRDIFLFRDTTLITGLVMVFVAALIMNLLTGNFTLGFEGQSVSHTSWLWNFLGMALVGYGSVYERLGHACRSCNFPQLWSRILTSRTDTRGYGSYNFRICHTYRYRISNHIRKEKGGGSLWKLMQEGSPVHSQLLKRKK